MAEWRQVLLQFLKMQRNHYGASITHKHHTISLEDDTLVCISYPPKILNRFHKKVNHTRSPRQNRNPKALFVPTRPFMSYNMSFVGWNVKFRISI